VAGALVVIVGSLALVGVTWRGHLAVRRLPLLRVAFVPLAVIAAVTPGTAGLVAFAVVLAAIAATAVIIYRRHGVAAWPHRLRSAPTPAPQPALDPQLHRNGVRRRRPRDPRADAVVAHERELLEALADHGIVRAQAIGYDGTGPLLVYLGTDTDARLEQLGSRDPLLAQVRQVLASCGLSAEVVEQVRTTGISAETVDRDFAGNWFAAMR
jgi:hypothetical protein